MDTHTHTHTHTHTTARLTDLWKQCWLRLP